MKELKKEPELYLVDEDCALVCAVTEMMGILSRLFCGCHRSMRLYLHYDRNVEKFDKPVTKDFSDCDFPERCTPGDKQHDVDALRHRIAT